MKLWHKIFLYTFLMFEVAFNASMIFLIERNFNNNLQKEVERGLSEQLVVQSVLASNSTFIIDKLGYSEQQTRDLMQFVFRDYTRYFDQKGIFIELLDEQDKVVFSSFILDYKGPREELAAPLTDKRQYIIRDIGSSSYLFVTNLLTITDKKWKLTYIRDITDVYHDRSSLYGFYIRLNIFITTILAAGLFGLLWMLTRPVRELTRSVQSIAEGRYSDRVKIGSHDEIGILAQSVNAMAKAVEDKVVELNYSAESKQHFIECLTHELKTPLTSIIGYADFLRTTRYNPDNYVPAVDYIYKEGKRLESLSFKLMDLILLDNQSLDLYKQDISPLCRELEDTFRPLLQSNNMELTVLAESGTAVVDKDLFKVVLTNLLDNAMKASRGGDRIFLRCRKEDAGGCLVEVEDEGRGIPEKDIPHVFEPFFMVDQSRASSRSGAGLGLSICAQIVKLHQGVIRIHSKEGQGTTIRIEFP
jgi:signal transduction histidine kinase